MRVIPAIRLIRVLNVVQQTGFVKWRYSKEPSRKPWTLELEITLNTIFMQIQNQKESTVLSGFPLVSFVTMGMIINVLWTNE